MAEFDINNILPGLDAMPNAGQIAKILEVFSNSPASVAAFSLNTIADALENYRTAKYDTASSGNASYMLSLNNSVSRPAENKNSAYSAILKTIYDNGQSEKDEADESLEKENELAVLRSIASADLYYTGKSSSKSVDEAAERYLGYEYAGRSSGSAPALSPMRKETGGDAMLFCRQVLNDIGVKWTTRYVDYALQEAESADILIKWPYDYPATISAFRSLAKPRQDELERKAYRLLSTKLIKDTDIGLPEGYDEATENPYYLQPGDIIISPEAEYTAIVVSDQSIYHCTDRTILDCPYIDSENRCPQAKTCLSRQCGQSENGTYIPNIYGDGHTRYDADNSENTGGINIPNDPRNECISTVYSFGTLHVVHDSVELRRKLIPWPAYIIKTSELVRKLKEA